MKVYVKSILIIVSLAISPVMALAGGVPPDVNDIPFDGGLSLLVAGGIGYGIKKVRESRRQKDASLPGEQGEK